MNINLNLYKYFFEVARFLSYTKAAESLMISQPSLSYSIKVLEEQLNEKLFRKENNKIYLTDYGKMLYKRLEVAFQELEGINTINECNNIVRIGLRPYYSLRLMPYFVAYIN